MSAVAEKINKTRPRPDPDRRFHSALAVAFAVLIVVTFVGCRLTSIHHLQIGRDAIALVLVLAMLAPLPIYWHQKHRIALRESTLVVAWEALLSLIIPILVYVAGRSPLPLQDGFFGRLDDMLGINDPAIQAWAQHHWLGGVFNWSYALLPPLLVVSALAPALLGKVRYAREFLLTNMTAFAIGLPAFALLPAIGPWVFYHTTPNPAQANCQHVLLALRAPGPILDWSQMAGLVCFPSFHVIWAILCASALWAFRPLRVPVALLSILIIGSTLTTGWHYFTDVLAGLVIACISLAFAKWCTRALERMGSAVAADEVEGAAAS